VTQGAEYKLGDNVGSNIDAAGNFHQIIGNTISNRNNGGYQSGMPTRAKDFNSKE